MIDDECTMYVPERTREGHIITCKRSNDIRNIKINATIRLDNRGHILFHHVKKTFVKIENISYEGKYKVVV